MSLSASLSNAVSGLTAVSRAAELVSANVANAMTESYGRRELSLGAATVGGQGAGVQISGVERVVNQTAIADRRLAQAELGYHDTRASFFLSVEKAIGTPDVASSLSGYMDRFDQSLIAASATPSSNSRLSAVVDSATGLTAKINEISERLLSAREVADSSIGAQVVQLNSALTDVDRLNREIRGQVNSGGDPSGLMDQRQAIVDTISSIVPVQAVSRDYGQIALVTPNGTTLVDYQAAQFEFNPTGVITPDMTLSSGALSSLQIFGASSVSGSAIEAVSGGSLAASFALRDQDIPAVQANLDALSRDLMIRAAEADTTLLPGQVGLFTDADGALNPLAEAGLASRLSVNSAIQSSTGNAPWRLRDGINAAVQGAASDNTLLNAYEQVFSSGRLPVSGVFAGARSSSALIGDFLSQVGQERHASEQRQSFQAMRVQAFRDVEQAGGVDTDQEMQKLLLIERNYAANAKIIQAVDEMLQSLLRI
ncbi:flagellar hook-associated protein 1 FlgK [Litoreibacter meonggei]|uniref:Flagellar hook-associated protein 1 n=1 Tax=Litoreibacter meonggei TaxID=1049199 RepID=A0A497VG74_9RHOB|nr:flagellar hook-associated protein FlgK [Litoreibacter meonggei]RLJ41217.1 flagellar hook-associated protein 1 FlgK [Litoreibacter meonggei]